MVGLMKSAVPEFAKDILRKTRRRIIGMPSQFSNVEYNRFYWNRYAKNWDKAKITIENPEVKDEERKEYISHLGDEWGRVEDVNRVVAEFIYPCVTTESIVAEIGSGGGRIASLVVGKTRELYCFDISKEMLKRAQTALSNYPNAQFHLLEGPHFHEAFVGKFDFVYSFDVFVHLDLHTIWKYFGEVRRILKDDGKAFIHTSNLKAPGGWQKFSSQKAYRVADHYFISPEIIEILAQRSNLRIIKRSAIDPTNFYLNRDLLVVLEKE